MTTAGTNIGGSSGLRTGASTGRVVSTGTKILNGTVDATLFNIDERQKMAVGAILDGRGKNFCTGTLVGDNIVLTAAHCVKGMSPDSIQFALGPNSASPKRVFDIAAIKTNPLWNGTPAHDNALLILYESATAYASPISINRERLSSSVIGYQVQNVGYGTTSTTSSVNTEKWWTAEPVVQLDEGAITVDGRQVSSVCKGDSGSPTLYRFANGSLRVLGTLHGGEVSCLGLDKYARADLDTGWLMSAGGTLSVVDSAEQQQAYTIPHVTTERPFFKTAGIGWIAGIAIAGLAVGAVFGRLTHRG